MKWNIPAKTFLLGEYVALREAPAILVTTSPYFEVSLEDRNNTLREFGKNSIHPQSPAGLWWSHQKSTDKVLQWHDPYHGCGGLGASSAQFIGSYVASCLLKNITASLNDMLEAYYQCAWNGQGLRPSGYDLIAQTLHGCVYINKQTSQIKTYSWPFKELSFLLVHTGVKLATHHHLQKTTLPEDIHHLSALVDKAKEAFESGGSSLFIECVNAYHEELAKRDLVTEHSLELINQLSNYPEVLAVKGCGALGADILLIITSSQHRDSLSEKLRSQNKKIMASEIDLVQEKKNMVNI